MLYYIFRSLCWFLCEILFPLKIYGVKNLPTDNKIIIAVNHSSYLDPVVMTAAVPKRIRWIVRKDVYYVWWLKWLFKMTGTIPENGSIGSSLSALKSGHTVGVFPEGGRSPDGKLQAGKKGVAILALRSGAMVIPCTIKGAFEAYPPSAIFPKPGSAKVFIGRALRFDRLDAPDEAAINSALDKIMSAIKFLIEESDEDTYKINKTH